MPFDPQAFENQFFGQARKGYADYEKKFTGHQPLHAMMSKVGALRFQRLVDGLYPDQLYSVNNGLNVDELTALADLSAVTLRSLSEVAAPWIKAALRVVANVRPDQTVVAAPNTVNQTTQDATYANHIVTEVDHANRAPRNLIFDEFGICSAEINFANHGGSATSGHAHVYPVKGMPITGHHTSGTPHFGQGDYPDAWRALPGGVAPRTALWT